MKKNIILASASPRRIHMMKTNGYDPIVMPAAVDETLPAQIAPKDAVLFLALKKALFIEEKLQAENHRPGDIIIAADTVVYKDEILGKPVDRTDAFAMLSKIKNTSHEVATGVAILVSGTLERTAFYDVTKVFCKDYSDAELNAYLDTDEPYDKAGAYAIQGIFSKHIDRYEGSFNTVVGFPWELIAPRLQQLLYPSQY